MKWIVCAAVAIAAGLGGLLWVNTPKPPPPNLSGPVVKIEDDKGGHGTGFSIPNGLIVTAAHVVEDNAAMTIRSDTGQVMKAEVIFVNKARDLALLKPERPIFKADRLACRKPEPGEIIHIYGNPGNMDFVTVWGFVSGTPRQNGPWKNVAVANIAIIPGQSGGPVYDKAGAVLGIAVGVMVIPLGFSGTMVELGYFVPAVDLCDLLNVGAA